MIPLTGDLSLQDLGDLQRLSRAYYGALLYKEPKNSVIRGFLDKALDDVVQETKAWARQHKADGRHRDAEFLYRRASFNESISLKGVDLYGDEDALPTWVSIYEKMGDYPAAETAQETLLRRLFPNIPDHTTREQHRAVCAYVKMLSDFRKRVLDISFPFDKLFERCMDLFIVYRIAALDIPQLYEIALKQDLIILEPKDNPCTLHVVVEENAVHLARSLIEKGAEIDERDSLACTPLHRAAQYAEPEMIELLLDYGADIEAVDGSDQTPLHRALIGNSDERKLELLINAKVKMEARDRLGRTALMVAIQDDLPAVAGFLVQRGANIENSYELAETPLLLAIRYEREWAVKLLIRNGASLVGGNPQGDTALYVATGKAQASIVQILLDHGAMTKTTVDQQNARFDTSLCRAVKAANTSIIEMLLHAGADTCARDYGGKTALHQAVMGGEDSHEHIVNLLQSHSAPLDAVDNYGQTVFHLAVEYKRPNMISILIRHAGPNRLPIICGMRDCYGDAALDDAVVYAKNTKMFSVERAILHMLEGALGLNFSSI